MGTPRTVATGKTSAGAMTQLLDSERRLLLNQQRAEMERKDQELQVCMQILDSVASIAYTKIVRTHMHRRRCKHRLTPKS